MQNKDSLATYDQAVDISAIDLLFINSIQYYAHCYINACTQKTYNTAKNARDLLQVVSFTGWLQLVNKFNKLVNFITLQQVC